MNPAAQGVAERYIGLMSGTSLDGIDAVLAEIDQEGRTRLIACRYQPYAENLRQRLLELHTPQSDEIHLAALTGNELAKLYAEAVEALVRDAGTQKQHIKAIGCHGQTVRHRPESGYTLQLGNAALLAELTGIKVVADFRSRDIAAGGQGAPLVPAFHARVLGHPARHRVIANIGGISNVTDLPPTGEVRGWDTGPGNMLLDGWIQRHRGERYDRDGAWGASGRVDTALLDAFVRHGYLSQRPPKSAGREQFNLPWLESILATVKCPSEPADVQATLLEFTAVSLADAVRHECLGAEELYICGGGAYNSALMERLRSLLSTLKVDTTAALGVDPDWVEALAFAWLARQSLHGIPANLPAVTGARGLRILGAIHPA